MEAHTIRWDVFGRSVEHLAVQVDDFAKRVARQGPELPIPAGRQVRAIEL
jgi:hypothetical protein